MLLENKGYKDNRNIVHEKDEKGFLKPIVFEMNPCVVYKEPQIEMFDPESFECMVDCKEMNPRKHAKCLSLQQKK